MAFFNSQPNNGIQSVTINMTGDMKAMLHVWDSEFCKLRKVSPYYHKNVPASLVCAGYSDDITVVDFGKTIRFHYVFNPFMQQNLSRIFDEKFDLNPKDVDLLLFNNEHDKFISCELQDIFKSTKGWEQ